MAWNDDSWRDGYDAWKLASPDEDGPEEDYCEHGHYSIDILSGRAECDQCPHSWYVSDDEIRREIERQASYDEYLERENSRQWWRDLFAPILDPINSIRWKLRRLRWSWKRAPTIDDDIPF